MKFAVLKSIFFFFSVFFFSAFGFLNAQSGEKIVVYDFGNSGIGTFRAAIQKANNTSAEDTIVFDTKNQGDVEIMLDTPLDTIIHDLVIIGGPMKPPLGSKIIIRPSTNYPIASDGLTVKNCYIEITGMGIINFKKNGISIIGKSQNKKRSYIGKNDAINGNMISGNIESQILLQSAEDVSIEANLIGVNIQQNASFNFGEYGIKLIECKKIDIGEAVRNTGNTIGGTKNAAIDINNCTDVKIEKNFIGIKKKQDDFISQPGSGIKALSNTNLSITGNVIAKCGKYGINLSNQTNAKVFRNFIGQNEKGAPFGNVLSGIYLDGMSSSNVIGSDSISMANFIGYNGIYGIELDPTCNKNKLSINLFQCNSQGAIKNQGIDNKFANNNISPPKLGDADVWKIRGNVNVDKYPASVDIYSTHMNCPDTPSGGNFIGRVIVPSSSMEIFEFRFEKPAPMLPEGVTYTAIVTDADSNSSEFSPPTMPCQFSLNLPETITICKLGEFIDMRNYSRFGDPGNKYDYQWKNDNGLLSDSSKIKIENQGIYIAFLTSCNGEVTISDTVTIKIMPDDLDLGEDIMISEGEAVTIGLVNGDSNYLYSWKPEDGLESPYSPLTKASPAQTTTYTLTVSSGPCNISQKITISVEQKDSLVWVNELKGSNDETATSLLINSKNEIIGVGNFSGEININKTKITSDGNNDDYFIVTLNSDGAQPIGKKGGGMSVDRAVGSTIDSDGNVWVVGTFSGKIDLAGQVYDSEGENDIFIAKYSPDGTMIIGKKGGGMSVDRVSGIAPDKNGGIIIAGLFSGKISMGNVTLESEPDAQEFYIFKISADGNSVIGKKGGGMSVDRVSVASDQNGNIILGGSYHGPLTIDQSVLSVSKSKEELFLVRFNPNLTLGRMFNHAGNVSSISRITQITTDLDQNIIVVGEFKNTLSLDKLAFKSIGPNEDVFIAKFSATEMALDWGKKGGGMSVDRATGVTTDSKGNIFFTGTFSDQFRFVRKPLISKGGRDFFVNKLTPEGQIIWNTSGGGEEDDSLAAIACDKRGSLFAMGDYRKSAFIKNRKWDSAGGTDVFFAKFGFGNYTTIDQTNEISSIPGIYPNPNDGSFYLELPENLKSETIIQVFDIQGRQVYQNNCDPASDGYLLKIELQNLNSGGIYMVKVSNHAMFWTEKIIVNQR